MLMRQNQNLIGQCTASLNKDEKYVLICFFLNHLTFFYCLKNGKAKFLSYGSIAMK